MELVDLEEGLSEEIGGELVPLIAIKRLIILEFLIEQVKQLNIITT